MNPLKQFQPKLLVAAVLVGLCTMTGSAFAAPPAGAGGGGGSGGSGSGGGGSGSGEVLGDLVVLFRDANGVPILTPGLCQQPLAAPGVTVTNSVTGTTACTPSSTTESCKIPVDDATCAVVVGYESYLQAVDFARMSVARSPASVMDKQMADVLVNLSTASCLTLDPAGRLVYSSPDTADVDQDGDTTELVSSAVDSPLQNLAIYRELMTKGTLGNPVITLPIPFGGYGIIDTAAKSLGAASDKGGKIDVDLVVYLNQILGLDLPTVTTSLPKIPLTFRQEVKGVVTTVTKYFLNYGAYSYSRAGTYSNLPYPANIPAASPLVGYFDYLTPDTSGFVGPDGRPMFYIKSDLIFPTVFLSSPGFLGGNIGGFSQAGDDARAVIDFMHSHPVMAGYEAPVLCDGGTNPPSNLVDVSSKLQMPIQMTANTVREGTLTVTNLKGASASGTVTLKGINNKDGSVIPIVLSPSETTFGLAAGASKSWTVTFTGPKSGTTITWTATATASNDNNLTNNTASAITTVMSARGKGTSKK